MKYPGGNAGTKYYYSGAQRLAMRNSSGLTYLFGDHLGSTSVTRRLNDGQTIRQLYRPWGEVRYSSATLPTKYQYTGQYSYVYDFGFHFYQARWFDPQLGRFNQPDSLIPNPENTIDFDRYAFARNNPLRYTDSSGHWVCESKDRCDFRTEKRKIQPISWQLKLVTMAVYAESANGSYPLGAMVTTADVILNRTVNPSWSRYDYPIWEAVSGDQTALSILTRKCTTSSRQHRASDSRPKCATLKADASQ